MIVPYPESDLTMNTMVLGSDIIQLLKNYDDFVFVEKIMKSFLKKDKRRTPDQFLDTLTFLFIVDLIEHEDYKIKLKRHDYTQPTLFDNIPI